jgi:hypothetical protein
LKAALSRIVFHKVGEIICRNQIVQRNNCNIFPQKSLLNYRSKHETTNAAKAIYSNIFHSAYCIINSRRQGTGDFLRPAWLCFVGFCHCLRTNYLLKLFIREELQHPVSFSEREIMLVRIMG